MATLLEKTKTALRLKTQDESILDQITGLIWSGIADLKKTAGVDTGDIAPEADFTVVTEKQILLCEAIVTYVRVHFGEPDDYDRLYRSYEMQKANLKTAFRLDAPDVTMIDYDTQVENKPKINGVTLIGDKSSKEIKVQHEMDEVTPQDIDEIIYGG